MTATSPTSIGPGAIVAGRYRIDGQLGRGASGNVYRATQLALGRPIALKVLAPSLVARDEWLSRFQREARIAQTLDHPNTVKLLDYGRGEDGTPYIAFELLAGRSLEELLRGGPLPVHRVARIASQVLKSLMDAHAKGIAHRDVKPSNVFLCDFQGEHDFVKVLDFGIARAVTPDRRDVVTRLGHAVGTPSYMAPEQVSAGVVSPAVDVYALGLVIAEAIAGRVIVQGATMFETCMEQASPRPVPHPPEVRVSPLWPVVERATQKRPDLRHPSAAEMLRHIEACVAGAGPESGSRPLGLPSGPPDRASGAPRQPAGSSVPPEGRAVQAAEREGPSLLFLLLGAVLFMLLGGALAFVACS